APPEAPPRQRERRGTGGGDRSDVHPPPDPQAPALAGYASAHGPNHGTPGVSPVTGAAAVRPRATPLQCELKRRARALTGAAPVTGLTAGVPFLVDDGRRQVWTPVDTPGVESAAGPPISRAIALGTSRAKRPGMLKLSALRSSSL